MGKPKERSPYNLLQEVYREDVWKMMVCCMLLNQTTRRQVDAVRHNFFSRWPNARKAMNADPTEMAHVIRSLGFSNRRTESIIRMSREFMEKPWKKPIELYGLGQYAQDSFDIFVRRAHVGAPSDKFLSKYVKWENCKNPR